MKIKSRHIIIVVFTLLLVLILSSETIWRMCSVCGVQDFERSLFGKKIELISTHEIDEYGSYAKWKEKHGTTCSHQWVLVDEYSDQVQKHVNRLQ